MSFRWIVLALTVLLAPTAARAAPAPLGLVGKATLASSVAQGSGAAAPFGALPRLGWIEDDDDAADPDDASRAATTYSYLAGTGGPGIGAALAALMPSRGGGLGGHPPAPDPAAARSTEVSYAIVDRPADSRPLGPLPGAAAATLLASGLGAFLGLLGWKRQRRQHA